jgi:pyruvate-ferredoxin/flavodoxin oxidoreductase
MIQRKSGGFHLFLTFVFGDTPIRFKHTRLKTPNFLWHVMFQAYLRMYDVTRGLQKNGTFLLNTIWDGDELV